MERHQRGAVTGCHHDGDTCRQQTVLVRSSQNQSLGRSTHTHHTLRVFHPVCRKTHHRGPMSWKISPYMSQTLGCVTTCPERQHFSPHITHTLACASTCVLQLEVVTVSPREGFWEVGAGIWGAGKGWICGSPLLGDTACARVHGQALPKPQCHLPPPVLLQGHACRADGSSVTARVGMLTPGKLSGAPKLGR